MAKPRGGATVEVVYRQCERLDYFRDNNKNLASRRYGSVFFDMLPRTLMPLPSTNDVWENLESLQMRSGEEKLSMSGK
jgi:hypothetical protein